MIYIIVINCNIAYLVLLFEMRDVKTSQFLISKRPEKGLLAGLWEFPNILLNTTKPKSKSKKKSNDDDEMIEIDMKTKHKAIQSFLNKLDLSFNNVIEEKFLGRTKHIFSHLHHYYYVEYILLDKLGKKSTTFKDKDYIEAIEKLKKEEISDDEDENYEPSKRIKLENDSKSRSKIAKGVKEG